MTQPTDDAHQAPASPSGPDALDKFFSFLRRLGVQRRTEDKWIGGVASGVADRFNIDPVIVRAGFVLLGLFFGFGITTYLVAWALLPDRDNQIAAERAIRQGHAGSIVLLVLASLTLLSEPWWFGQEGFGRSFPWGLVAVGGIVWFIVHQARTKQTPEQRAAWDQRAATWGEKPGDGSSGQASQASQAQFGPPAPYGPQDPSAATPPYSPAQGRPMAPRGPVIPPTPRRRSGGLLMAIVAIGLALVTYGLTLWAGNQLGFSGDHELIAFSAALGALGILILALGIAGWRAGFVGFLAVCTAIAALTAGILGDGFRFGGRVGEATWTPSAVSTDANYNLLVGDGRLDLTNLPGEGLTGATVPAYVGLGDLTVVIPDDVTVDFRGQVGLGEIQVLGPDSNAANYSGTDVARRQVFGNGPTELTVKAGVGVGQITVVKE